LRRSHLLSLPRRPTPDRLWAFLLVPVGEVPVDRVPRGRAVEGLVPVGLAVRAG